MAGRNFKQGLDYFPMDVLFFENDKVKLINADYGPKGVLIYLRLLCKIYKRGYHYKWGADECSLLANEVGPALDEGGAEGVRNFVGEVIRGLVNRCFFDRRCFDQFSILTSVDIQEIFLQACDRRKCIEVISEYWIAARPTLINVNIISINAVINGNNDDINRQRESKVKRNTHTLSIGSDIDTTRARENSTSGDLDRAASMLSYIESYYPFFNSMPKPLTLEQATAILAKYTPADVKRLLGEMANKWSGIYSNTSTYQTFISFAERDSVIASRPADKLYTYEEMCDAIAAGRPANDFEMVAIGQGKPKWKLKK